MMNIKILILALTVIFSTCFSAHIWAETKKISGTTNVKDAFISEYWYFVNFGSEADLFVKPSDAGDINNLLITVKNVAFELGAGATITACICSLYCYSQTTGQDDNISAYRVFKPWTESGATWNYWASPASDWGTAGCNCAGDDGVDNSQDGTCDATGRDRKSTVEATVGVTAINTWYGWDISTSLAQGWYDGTIGEWGIVLIGNTNLTDPTKCPFWTFTYTVEEEEEVIMRIKDDWRFRSCYEDSTNMRAMDWRFSDTAYVSIEIYESKVIIIH